VEGLKPICAAGEDVEAGQPARSVSVLVPAGGAVGYELKLPDGAVNARSTAIDTVNGPADKVVAGAETASFRGIEYITRAGWGADESLR
jgi:hypothetical protein